jgi:hypothetical protein
VVEALTRRSLELVSGLAELSARVKQLEEMVDALREECAQLGGGAEKRAAARQPRRARRRPPLGLLAGRQAGGHAAGRNGAPAAPFHLID